MDTTQNTEGTTMTTTNYGIDDQHGNRLHGGIQSEERARELAQRLANERQEVVSLYTDGLEDSETVHPERYPLSSIRGLPARLFPAYDWTAVAGELDVLAQATRQAQSGESVTYLDDYCRESADNAREHGETDVTESDLQALGTYLVAAVPDGRQ
jgi:hypothetical protein